MSYFQKNILILCLTTIIFAFPEPSYSKDSEVKIRLHEHPFYSAFYLGIKKNYFADEGVKIKPVRIVDYAQTLNALKNGKIDLAILPSTLVLQENDRNFFLLALSSVMNGSAQSVWVSSSISKVEDLIGKTVAITNRQSITTLFMLYALSTKKIDPNKLKLQLVKSTNEKFILAAKGSVQAISLPRSRYFAAKKANLVNLLQLNTFLPMFPSYVIVCNKDWALKNKDLVGNFLMGQIKAQWFINFNLSESVNLLGGIFPSWDKNLLEEVTAYNVVNSLVPVTGMIDIEFFKKGINLFKEHGLKIKSSVSNLIDRTVSLNFLSYAKNSLCKKCWRLPSCPPK